MLLCTDRRRCLWPWSEATWWSKWMAGRSEVASTPGVWQKVRPASAWPICVRHEDCTISKGIGVFQCVQNKCMSLLDDLPPSWGILEKGWRRGIRFSREERLSPLLFIMAHKWLVVVVLLSPPFFLYKALSSLQNFFIWNCCCWWVSVSFFLSCLRVILSFLFFFFFLSALFHDWQRALLVKKTIFHLYSLC